MKNNGQCRVLVIDDDPMTRDVLKPMLSLLGAIVVGEAENGEEGIQAYGKHNPDITLLDIKMPGKDGVDTLKDIIGLDPNAVVIILTAVSDMELAESCLKFGARNYIRKGAGQAALNIMLKAELDLVTSS